MVEKYFKRVNKLTPTRFWINNPTPGEAKRSIAAGAIGCTTNPTFCMRIIRSEREKNRVFGIIDKVIEKYNDDNQAADIVQQKLVKDILDIFLPLYEKKPGKEGFVSIQGDPNMDIYEQHMIDEALRYRKLGKNFITKIPVTKAGLKALEVLIPEGMPMIATEVMGISQAIHTCEIYERISKKSGKYPPLLSYPYYRYL